MLNRKRAELFDIEDRYGVTIEVASDGELEGARMSVEAGGPPPSTERRTGFGTVMMRGMIEKQLRGEVRRDWTDTGLAVTISIPGELAALQDPASP